jgi:uncharacterized protein involved in exopolysaccharide biosynthesis
VSINDSQSSARPERPPPGTGDPTPADRGEVTLVEIANILLRRRRLVILLPLVLAFAVGLVSLTRPRMYAAGAAFLPEATNASSSNASSLAQQFGISLGSQSQGHSLDFYAELLRGRTLLRGLVETQFPVVDDDSPGRTMTLIEYYQAEPDGVVPAWQSAIETTRGRLLVQTDLRTGTVSFSFEDTNPVLAEQVAKRLLELLNEFNVETRQSQALEEGRFVSERLVEASNELLKAEEELKQFLRNNRQFANSPELLFEHDRLQRNVALRQEIVSSLSQSLEQARIDAVRDTPVLTIVAAADDSARPQARGTVLKTIVGFVAGLVLACMGAFMLELGRRMRADAPDDYKEFSVLRAEALNDLRHPVRLLRPLRVQSRPAAGTVGNPELDHPDAALVDAGSAEGH